MMKLKLHSQIGLVEDLVTVADPWNSGMTLVVNRSGSRKVLRAQRDRARKNPVVARMNAVMNRVATQALMEGAEQVDEESVARLLPAAIEAELNRPFDDSEVSDPTARSVQEAVDRLEAWSGPGAPADDKGATVPCTEETKRELLTDPTPVPPGHAFAGYSLGAALVEVVMAASEGADILRNAWLREAGKGSGPGSDGSSEPGPAIPQDESSFAPDSNS